MPVIGHALVGWATGILAGPPVRAGDPAIDWKRWWIPALVCLAYFPDIITYVLQTAGFFNSRQHGHSWIAATLTVAVAALTGPALGLRRWSGAAVAAGSVWLHDVMDVLQGSPASMSWPLPLVGQHVPVLIPDTLIAEAIVCGAAFGIAVVVRQVDQRSGRVRSSGRPEIVPRTALARTALLLCVGVAATVNVLRDRRAAELTEAARLVSEKRYEAALNMLDQVARWPGPVKGGRVPYLRAEAHRGLHDEGRAERYYAQAIAEDPSYFWAVADLAILRASSRQPIDERKRVVDPLVSRLSRDFAEHPALPRVLRRIETELSER